MWGYLVLYYSSTTFQLVITPCLECSLKVVYCHPYNIFNLFCLVVVLVLNPLDKIFTSSL